MPGAPASLTRRQALRLAAGALPLPAASASLPILGRSGPGPASDPPYLSNGLLGLRPSPLALTAAPAYAAGFTYRHPVQLVPCLAPAPFPLGADIRFDGSSLLDDPARAVPLSQKIDFQTGGLETEFHFTTPAGARLHVRVLQFASRSQPSLLCQRVELRADSAATLTYSPRILFDLAPGSSPHGRLPPGAEADAWAEVHPANGSSRLGIACRVEAGPGWRRLDSLSAWQASARPGDTLVISTIAALVSSFYHPDPGLQAIRMANWGLLTGWTKLWHDNRSLWDDLWLSRVSIDGPAADQRALDAAFFYLHSSLHPSNLNGMPPYGLSQSEHYFGHSFWDTETWSFLPVLLAAPDAARSLLEFRLRGLEWARRAAALFGYRGLQFPWEASPLDGEEVTPVFAATGWAEQHIVPDVALAFWMYQLAAGDRSFLARGSWPVLSGVAQWILSRGSFTPRGFEITNIMGPNEQENGVSNSAYVNLACRMALEAAVACAALAGERAPSEWSRAARSLFLPQDAQGTLIAGDASPRNAFADLSFLYVFEPPVAPDALRRACDSFLRAPREPSIGFASAAQASLAAALGHRSAAADLFRAAWEPFWLEPFGMIREAASQSYGCFLTDYGSLLQTAMLGFTGLRIRAGDCAALNASLPAAWKQISLARLFLHGRAFSLQATHAARPRLTPLTA